MPTFNGNNIYLSWDGVDISGLWTTISINPSNADVDSTAGSGAEDEDVLPGLSRVDVSWDVVYDTAMVDTVRPLLKAGRMGVLVFGSEGNVAGKPKHEQKFKVSGAPFGQDIKKGLVVFSVSMRSAGAPTADFFGTGAF